MQPERMAVGRERTRQTMQTRTQRQGSYGPGTTRGATDWHALEVQLNRTRTILQEILLHLQEVLKNLKSVRAGATSFGAASRTESGSSRFGAKETRFTGTAGSRFRTQSTYQSPSGRAERTQTPPQGPSATTSQTTSDRFRAKPHHPGFETRSDAGAQSRPGSAREKTATEGPWAHRPGPSASRPTGPTGSTSRERPRTESTWRTKTTPGPDREARSGPTGSTSRPGPSASTARPSARPTSRAQGFNMDRDRQYRAREMARKSGMNLKCAYDILCLDYPCSVDEIKIAYRHMARLHHPDLGGDEEAMKDVNVAYELAMRFCAGPRRASTAWAV